ncbi:hypothetical protein H0H93_004886 [Arthromyces matolae]|nr:hypothetical protein H0H93_004886 [Arthromyces matolae]
MDIDTADTDLSVKAGKRPVGRPKGSKNKPRDAKAVISTTTASPTHTALELPNPDAAGSDQMPPLQPDESVSEDFEPHTPLASLSFLDTQFDGALNIRSRDPEPTCVPSETTAINDVPPSSDASTPLSDEPLSFQDIPNPISSMPDSFSDFYAEEAVEVNWESMSGTSADADDDPVMEYGSDDYSDEFLPMSDDDDAPIKPSVSTTSSSNGQQESQTRNAPKPRQTLPRWLNARYEDVCLQLRKEMNNNPSHKPSCYDHGQFILEPKAPFFATTQISQLAPSMFYQPRYFIWIPHVFTKIPCPACSRSDRENENGQPIYLRHLGWPRGPRRTIDIEDNIYIVGYRYNCAHEKCKKTYQSWSPEILRVLPRPLALQFTFHLTYRCGLTDRVVTLLRSAFQRGQGPRPFAEMLRVSHIQKYEHLEMEYLELVKLRISSVVSGMLSLHEPFSSWDDLDGYGSYIPSARYFSDFYNHLIESHASEIDQQMAMLSARMMCIDHSHKAPKHIGKVGGEPVFAALHTCVNKYGEIRKMTLTATKAHDQCMPALAEIPHSLRKYGHGDIEGVFTDSASDKAELERIMPSLLKDVVPVPTSSEYPKLTIPSDWPCAVLRTTYQINTRLNIIMDELSKLPDTESISLALDMEYLQISWNMMDISIHLISRVKKVGVHVKADLTRLHKDCGYGPGDLPFVGGVELGAISKGRSITPRANVSLADLSAMVLRQYLPKDEDIRVSRDWDNLELSESQKQYASLDVYAAWCIYQSFVNVASGKLANALTSPGTPIKLISRDRTSTVAYGFIAPDRPTQVNGIRVAKCHVIVNITTVLQGAYLVRHELLSSKIDTPLHQISQQTPFSLLCLARDVQITPFNSIPPDQSRSAPLPSLPYLPENHEYTLSDATNTESTDVDDPEIFSDWLNEVPYDADEEDTPRGAPLDDNATFLANEMLQNTSITYEDTQVRSRVWLDIWHLMNQIKIPLHHGLRRPFFRALRDALFILDPEDKAAVEAVLAKRNITWNQMVLRRPEWVWRT